MTEIRKYVGGDKSQWDEFVASSKNGTFLLHRDYMDYHAARFEDTSLMIYERGDLVALLPATRHGECVASHGGLTYGGLIIGEGMTLPTLGKIFEALVSSFAQEGGRALVYKTIPTIYHRVPAEEDRYWLFVRGAQLIRRDVLTVIDYTRTLPFQARRQRTIRKAEKSGVVVRRTDDYAAFWAILTENLQSRYGRSPVHSLDEITRLATLFPAKIRLIGSYRADRLVAGAVVYLSSQVCHVQYNAASEEGKQYGALDVVLSWLVAEYSNSMRFFDFGASTERDGRHLNAGLVEYKEGFGARTVTHDFYELNLAPSE